MAARLSNWLPVLRAYGAIWWQRKRRGPSLREQAHFVRDYVWAAQQVKAAGISDRLVMHPRLGERTSKTPFDPHYFYQSIWATQRLLAQRPASHVDVASYVFWVGLLSCAIPVEFVDIRPLDVQLPNLTCTQGTVLDLPYADQSLASVSCLHVAEHIGLGRYGDPLDIANGTRLACAELQRVLQPGGQLYFSLPISGENRIEFNGHRVQTVERTLSYFPELTLVELSGVTDQAQYVEHIQPDVLGQQTYACGLFLFTRQG